MKDSTLFTSIMRFYEDFMIYILDKKISILYNMLKILIER